MSADRLGLDNGWTAGLVLVPFEFGVHRHPEQLYRTRLAPKKVGDFRFRDLEIEILADITTQSLAALRLFFAWLGQAPIRQSQSWARKSYKAVRRHRLHRRKEWEETLPAAIRVWAEQEIYRRVEQDELLFADSFRVARVGVSSQLRRFKRDRSCCGRAEWIAIGPDGNRYLLGCNFGH